MCTAGQRDWKEELSRVSCQGLAGQNRHQAAETKPVLSLPSTAQSLCAAGSSLDKHGQRWLLHYLKRESSLVVQTFTGINWFSSST